jgi:hypothetical protein
MLKKKKKKNTSINRFNTTYPHDPDAKFSNPLKKKEEEEEEEERIIVHQ